MTTLSDYATRYVNTAIERDEHGVLQVRCTTVTADR